MVTSVISFHPVSGNNIELLQQFIKVAGDSLLTFRYFATRPLSIINNHIITVIITEADQPVGYGHLDKENETVWLGIAVSENARRKGLGTQIMQYLINKGKEKNINVIDLMVDTDNVSAIRLYEQFGFKKESIINDRSIKMQLLVNE